MKSIFDAFERELVEAARRAAGDQHRSRGSSLRSGRASTVWRAIPAAGLIAVCIAIVLFAATSLHAHSRLPGASTGISTVPTTSSVPAQRLADGAVNCFTGTTGRGITSKTFESGVASANGQDAITLCRQSFADNVHGATPASKIVFVACQADATTVDVYIASGKTDQCARAGDSPLPSTYLTAIARIGQLEHALLQIQDAQNCTAPRTLARQAMTALTRLGLTAWRVTGPFHNPLYPAGTGGTCGTFDVSFEDAHDSANINSALREVGVSFAPPRSIATRLNHIGYELYTRTYEHCYDADAVRRVVRQWFAGIHLQPLYATTARPRDGGVYEPASERLYQSGCVRFDNAVPTDDNHHVDVLLYAKGAEPGNETHMPPASQYRP